MTNASVALVYLPVALPAFLLLVGAVWRDRRRLRAVPNVFFMFCLTVWALLEMAYFILPDPFAKRYCFDLKLIFISLSSLSVFIAMVDFYRMRRVLPKWVIPALCVIPAVTTVLALTSPWHSLLCSRFRFVTLEPLVQADVVRAPWFYVHMVYCQAITVAITLAVSARYRRLPKAYRSGTILVLASVFVYFSFTTVETLRLDGSSPVDFTLIGTGVGNIFFYLAVIVNGRAHYLHIEQQEIFNYMDESVFILDANRRIVDANKPALNLLEILGRKLEYRDFDGLVEWLRRQDTIAVKDAEGGDGQYVYFLQTKYPLIYHLTVRPIRDGAGLEIGFFAMLTDITRNRLFVERLREIAGVDALTGLQNRYAYQEALRTVDRPENLPLSVIIGDVNGLKRINDALGHQAGDAILRAVADAIRACCPPHCSAARIGGDEFAILLPRCDREAAAHVIANINGALAGAGGGDGAPSIALGAATKTAPPQNINSLLDEADRVMYGAK